MEQLTESESYSRHTLCMNQIMWGSNGKFWCKKHRNSHEVILYKLFGSWKAAYIVLFQVFFLSRAQLFCFVLCCSFTNCPRWFDLARIIFCWKSQFFFFLVLILLSFSSSNSYVVWFSFSEIDHSSSHTGDSSHEQSCRNLKNSLDTV